MATQPSDGVETMLEEIEPAECATLLGATRYGRIAVVDNGRPAIIVLNHMVVGGNLLLRVGKDNRLARLTSGAEIRAEYEVDSAFPVGRSGWSVIVEGILCREPDPDLIVAAREQITAWAGGRRGTVLRLRIEGMSGRRAGRL